MNSWQRNTETFAREPALLQRITEPGYRDALALGAEVREEYHFLARGEYNENFVFTHPDTGKKYVLRVNHGSQMQLERQISYAVLLPGKVGGAGNSCDGLSGRGSP